MKLTTLATLVAAGLLGLAAAGCFNPFRPQVGTGVAVSEPAPRPSSPQGVLKLLRWCWINRRIAEYEELFTNDFEFAFTAVEAIDNAPIYRVEELDIARRLFVDGNANEPRAKRITLEFNSSLIPVPDQRAGKESGWHKEITTSVILRADLTESTWDVQGDVTFYLVRGDSARIPQTLRDRGFVPDPSRWYIERWEDKTAGGAGGAGLVAHVIEQARARGGGMPGAGAAGSTLAAGSPVASPQSGTPEIRGSWGGLKTQYRAPIAP